MRRVISCAQHPQQLLSLTTVSAAHRGGSNQRSTDLRDEVETLGMDAWSAKLMALRFHPGALSDAMHAWFHDVQRHSAARACMDLVDMLVACANDARRIRGFFPTTDCLYSKA